eukprot:7943181-Pyramimonas_sp.AAC.1
MEELAVYPWFRTDILRGRAVQNVFDGVPKILVAFPPAWYWPTYQPPSAGLRDLNWKIVSAYEPKIMLTNSPI